MPYDPEREQWSASYRAKQLVVLATDLLLASIACMRPGADAAADHLVEARVLPGCYRRRYDHRFLNSFRHTLEIARNLLVSDSPFLPNTASELAAHAILGRAHEVLADHGRDWIRPASAIDQRLPEQVTVNREYLADELASLEAAALEDTDVLALFEVPMDVEPDAHLSERLRPAERSMLRFENWLIPIATPPRPHITYDGRAWPVDP